MQMQIRTRAYLVSSVSAWANGSRIWLIDLTHVTGPRGQRSNNNDRRASQHRYIGGSTGPTTAADLKSEEKTTKSARNHWEDRNNHRRFFDHVAARLNIQQQDDWYKIQASDIDKLGGAGLMMSYYRRSLFNALSAVYPETEWFPWRFSRVSRGFWSNLSNQRRFFDWAAKQLGIRQAPDDWYPVSTAQIRELGGSKLLHDYYGNSLSKALATVYPEFDWLPWRFLMAPHGYWREVANQRKFFDWVASQLGVNVAPDDWYQVRTTDVYQLDCGRVLLHTYHGDSLPKALMEVYPELDWQPWRFEVAPKHFWDDINNQRRFFDWAAKGLAIQRSPDDWYRVSASEIERLGGTSLLRRYNGSLVTALRSVYPDIQWQPWLFEQCNIPRVCNDQDRQQRDGNGYDQNGNTDHHSNALQYIEYLAQELQIKQHTEWYRVSMDQIATLGGAGIIRKAGGLFTILKRLYPEHDWKEEHFHQGRSKKSAQRMLRITLRALFPDGEILEDYLHPGIRFSDSGERMQLDVYLPKEGLAFEYQGQQHFKDLYVFGPQAHYRENDTEKVHACRAAGVSLIIVPYWWDRSQKGLVELIQKTLPKFTVPPSNNSNNSRAPPASLL